MDVIDRANYNPINDMTTPVSGLINNNNNNNNNGYF